MIKHLTIASFCFALVFAASADTGAKDVSDEEEQIAAETAEGLDAFVDSAIRSGLLVPNEDALAADGTTRIDPEALAALGIDCSEDYPLDFSVVSALRRFNELPSTVAENESEVRAKLIKDLKSKIALGLYAEAAAQIATAPQEEWVAFRELLRLMDHRERPNLNYFAGLAACHEAAGLWYAVAQMVVFDPDGVEGIGARIGEIRSLPYNLREDVAVLIMPTLLIERRPDLGQQVLATFTPEDLDKSTRLRALKTAIIDMPTGAESDDRLVMLMSRPKLKLAALLILIERDERLRPTIHSFVLEEAWNVLEESDTQHDLDPILEFVIKHLGSNDLYVGLERVRGLRAAERDDVKASIDNHTMIALEGYLSDGNRSDAINALRSLNHFHEELPLNERGNALRTKGAERALELGLFSMVRHFLNPIERDPYIGLLLAQAAFWGHVNAELFEVRDEFPKEIEINHMAGIRALQANESGIATAAFSALTEHPDLQLDLLEQGALENNWTLWRSDWSDLVSRLSDPEVQRLARVRLIEKSKRGDASAAAREIKPYQIVDLLNSSRRVLSRPRAGATNEQ
ncbi:MAG: hypothetical protein AAFP81_06425 [Pseudomonadota bacterium]